MLALPTTMASFVEQSWMESWWDPAAFGVARSAGFATSVKVRRNTPAVTMAKMRPSVVVAPIPA